jgi:tRNA modification GTPase
VPDLETIVAISTPPGRGGIGIVRLSGPEARVIVAPILNLRQPLAHTVARFAEILHDGAKLDEAVVTYFAAPHSYTSEDVVEIAAHGSPVVLDFLLRYALAHGARLARPGEFTESAFLSGRIDLTQAEAVRDLIEAQTIVQARLAAEQMGGALSRRIAPIKELLVALIAVLEAGVDFAEDDVDVLPRNIIVNRITEIQEALAPVAASYAEGRVVRDGLSLAIVGRPNVGKSSLFNRLVERDRAIVTAIAGTTRDLVSEHVSMSGIPVELIDTAGLRETSDQAELIGIEKTREAIADADVILALVDASCLHEAQSMDQSWMDALSDPRSILVANKMDLVPEAVGLEESVRAGLGLAASTTLPFVTVSALNGSGIAELRQAILCRVHAGGSGVESGLLTNIRHHDAIAQSESTLRAALAAVEQGIPHEMFLLDLYGALQGLDVLTGTTTADDVLNRIFSTFCIGK